MFWAVYQIISQEDSRNITWTSASDISAEAEATAVTSLTIQVEQNGLAQLDAYAKDGRHLRATGLVDRRWLEHLDELEVPYTLKAKNPSTWTSALASWLPMAFFFAM